MEVYDILEDQEDLTVIEDNQEEEFSATILSTVFNVSNNVVGAGMLSLPWCLKEASVLEGYVLLVGIGILSGLSMVLLAICCEITQCFTFKSLGENTLGPTFGMLMQSCMFVYTFFSCVSFLILAGDFYSEHSGIAQGLCDSDSCDTLLYRIFSNRFNAILCLTLVILLPLSCLKNLNALRFTSLLSIVGMLYILGLVIFTYIHPPDSAQDVHIHWYEPTWGVFSAAPIINVSFIAHYNVPRFYQEMHDRTIKKFATAIFIALALCGSVYLGISTFGYLTFGSHVSDNVLKNMDNDNKGAIVGRLAMSAVVLFTYPLAFNSLRGSAISLFETLLPTVRFASNKNFYLLTVALVGLTFIPGSQLKHIGIVLDYKGATLGGLIGFAFGALIFLAAISPGSIPQCCLSQRDSCDGQDDHLVLRRYSSLNMTLLSGRQYMAWKNVAFSFFIWALVSGVMGVIVTTAKLL